MKADWNDAPLRVQKKKSHKPFIFALVIVAGLIALTFAAKNLTWQVDRLAKNALSTATIPERIKAPLVNTAEVKQTAEAAKDIYLEQVNRMLTSSAEWGLCEAFKDGKDGLSEAMRNQNCKPNPVAEMEWADPTQEDSERQTVFTDANYVQPSTVNTIRMPRAQAQPAQHQQRQQPYVTVVKETRDSCGFAKPGSIECRRARSQIYKTYNRACLRSGDSQSIPCRLAKSYEPSR